nr:hypothetical protein [Bacteroides intestinalis]
MVPSLFSLWSVRVCVSAPCCVAVTVVSGVVFGGHRSAGGRCRWCRLWRRSASGLPLLRDIPYYIYVSLSGFLSFL